MGAVVCECWRQRRTALTAKPSAKKKCFGFQQQLKGVQLLCPTTQCSGNNRRERMARRMKGGEEALREHSTAHMEDIAYAFGELHSSGCSILWRRYCNENRAIKVPRTLSPFILVWRRGNRGLS